MNFLLMISVGMAFLSLYCVIELVKRKWNYETELTRKIAHIATGFGIIIASNFVQQIEFLILTLSFLVLFIFFYKYKFFKSIHLEKRRTYGEITYILGLIILGIFTYHQREVFLCGILLLALPDALAGSYDYFTRKISKSKLHLLIHFLISMSILIFFFPIQVVILLAVIISFTEFVSVYGLDNLTVPAVYSAFILLIPAIS